MRIAYAGDSLGYGTAPHLRDEMPKSRITANCQIGRNSQGNLTALAMVLRSDDQAIVFDSGTNDGTRAALYEALLDVRHMVGKRHLFLFTLNGPFETEKKNTMLRDFSGARPLVHLIDWQKYSHEHKLLASDGMHSTPQGYRQRAIILEAAIRRAL